MSTLIDLEEQRRQPLIQSTPTNGNEEEIAASSSSYEPDAIKLTLTDSNQRLLSLDVFRGLTVAVYSLPEKQNLLFNFSPSIVHI